jgi:hypothetical protein
LWCRHTRCIGIFRRLYYLPLSGLLHSQRLCQPADLSGQDPQTDDNEAAHCSGRAGADESISEAEFVDRDAKPDHHQARKKGKDPDTIQ